tara:strand:+ start:417 stop:707 length:291 start_codon:yes stop_codon:yes gene_type:complete
MEIFNVNKLEDKEKYEIVTPLNSGFSVIVDSESNANVLAEQLGNAFVLGMAYTQALTGMSIKRIRGEDIPDTAATKASIEDLAEEVVTEEEQGSQS